MNDEQRETIQMLKDGLEEMNRTGTGECRICGRIFAGHSFDSILSKLGMHGEYCHPEVFGGTARAKGLSDND